MSDAVAGAIVSLSVAGSDGVTSAANRIQAKLQDVEKAGTAASTAAARSASAAAQVTSSFDAVDTRAEISFQRMRRIAGALTRLSERAALALGDEESAKRIEATGSAFGSAFRAGRIANTLGNLTGIPGAGAIAGLTVGAGVFAYEEITKLNGLSEATAKAARKAAEEAIKEREQKQDKAYNDWQKDHEDYLERVARQKADVARLTAALGGIVGQ